MKLTNEIYEYIKEEIVALFEEYDIKCIPISGFELAHKMGFQVIPYSSFSEEKRLKLMEIDEDGFFTDYNRKETILYNDRVNYKRVNMTFLHEIGHYVLGHTDDMDKSQVEAEAKFFAKYALAPPPLVHMIRPKSSEDIMRIFDLSREASKNVFAYYMKWLDKKHQVPKLTRYEVSILSIFKESYDELRC